MFHLHSPAVQKEIFACVGVFYPIFSVMSLTGRSGNAGRINPVVAPAPANLPGMCVGTVDSAFPKGIEAARQGPLTSPFISPCTF